MDRVSFLLQNSSQGMDSSNLFDKNKLYYRTVRIIP